MPSPPTSALATPLPMPCPSSSASTRPGCVTRGRGRDLPHQKAVLAALTQIDRQYVKNTSDPSVGFDCSGLTAFAWARAGLTITRQSSAQLQASRRVDQSEAVAGDLAQYPGHVMMYLGVGDAIVHAANQSTDVAIGFLSRGSNFGDPTG